LQGYLCHSAWIGAAPAILHGLLGRQIDTDPMYLHCGRIDAGD
jgi:hypothetical protein